MATKELLPFTINDLEPSVESHLKARFLGYREGLVSAGNGYVIPKRFQHFADMYYNFQWKEDDVVVMTYPKCGTTWVQEIVWTMRNNLDFDTATETSLDIRSPFLEFDSLLASHIAEDVVNIDRVREKFPSFHESEGVHLKLAEMLKSPRSIKTHLPFSLLHEDLIDKIKVIYVCRNPKDACVSYFNHHCLIGIHEFVGDFPEFVDFWCKDLMMYGSYWEHVFEGWSRRNHKNILYLFYEDMKKDILKELQRINEFLELSLSADQLQQVAEFTSFSKMKSRPSVNPTNEAVKEGVWFANKGEFIRKGVTGDWENYFTPELKIKFDKWMSKYHEKAKDIPVKDKI